MTATDRVLAHLRANRDRIFSRLVEGIALKRLGSPNDIAYGVLFFASDGAGWITGQVLSIDGGK